jgi:sialate O-acetylesterase
MLTIHPLCGNHAVLSAERPCVMGTAKPGARLVVILGSKMMPVSCAENGEWVASFETTEPCGPIQLTIRSNDGSQITVEDVWLGSVWLGSGQSNMEWRLEQLTTNQNSNGISGDPMVRFFVVPRAQSLDSGMPIGAGTWQVCDARSAGACSAVAYFFARKLASVTGQACGVVVSAWGGSRISAWMPLKSITGRSEYDALHKELIRAMASPTGEEEIVPHHDSGIELHAKAWASSEIDRDLWFRLRVPGIWQHQGWAFNGSVWFRSDVEIPEAWRGLDLELRLGVVDDHDRTFFNGLEVGATGPETANWWTVKRCYLIPAERVVYPKSTLCVRVFDAWGEGGIVGPVLLGPVGSPPELHLNLSGIWLAQVERELPLRSPGGPPVPPTALWNGMLAPLTPFSFDGVIWYQGESDVCQAELYRHLLKDLIAALRSEFRNPALPITIVQLAGFRAHRDGPVESEWASLREAQRRIAAEVSGCTLVSAVDLGEDDDIHPRHKKPLGERLAGWALARVLGIEGFRASGPLPKDIEVQGSVLSVRFEHGTMLRLRGPTLRGFELKDEQGKWHLAQGHLDGSCVLLSCPAVVRPLGVRHGWQDHPLITLEDSEGLPASPFELMVPTCEA